MLTAKDVPADSLLNKYLPCDYCDGYLYEINEVKEINPDDVQVYFWLYQPFWLRWLFNFRNFFAKIFGLSAGGDSREKFEDCIRNSVDYGVGSVEKQKHETVLKLTDSHLDAYLSVYVNYVHNLTKIYVFTVVQLKNSLGKKYFFLIKPFHKFIIKVMLKKAVNSVIEKSK